MSIPHVHAADGYGGSFDALAAEVLVADADAVTLALRPAVAPGEHPSGPAPAVEVPDRVVAMLAGLGAYGS